jgi:outer membrane protein with beta-barrel domain
MLRKFSLAAVALAALTAASAAHAAPAAATAGPTVGIGVAITPNDLFFPGRRTVEILVPIGLTPQFRLEPEIGIITRNTPGPDTSDFTIGTGIFYTLRSSQSVDMYVGGRIKLNFVDNGVDSGTDFFLLGALGGEYFLTPKFSLGLEGQFGYYNLSNANGDVSGVYTNGLGILRVYF